MRQAWESWPGHPSIWEIARIPHWMKGGGAEAQEADGEGAGEGGGESATSDS